MQFAVKNEADVMSYSDHYIPPELVEKEVDRTDLYGQQPDRDNASPRYIAKMPHPVTLRKCLAPLHRENTSPRHETSMW